MVQRVRDYRALVAEDWLRWNSGEARGTPTVVTYDFAQFDGLDSDASPFPVSYFWKMTAAQQASTRAALDEFSAVSGVFFVEVQSGGMLRFHNASGSDWGGWAWAPTVWHSGYVPSDVVIDQKGSYRPGSDGYETLLHELGHALGLKHPHEGWPLLADDLDTNRQTVMSYHHPTTVDDLGPLDIDALRHLYGDSQRTGDWAGYGTGGFADGTATPGRIHLTLSWWSDRILTTPNDTVLRALAGNDDVTGRGGDDAFHGGDGNDVLRGGAGNDLLMGERHADRLYGGGGADTLRGGDGVDRLWGGEGNDRLSGGRGDDVLNGGAGADRLWGGGGRDQLLGGDGDDGLSGGDWHDVLSGGNGDDTLVGGTGNDQLIGGPGDDRLIGGPGADLLWGGAGADAFVFGADEAGSWNTIADLELGIDTIDIARSGFGWVDATIRGTAWGNAVIEFAGADGFAIRVADTDSALVDALYFIT